MPGYVQSSVLGSPEEEEITHGRRHGHRDGIDGGTSRRQEGREDIRLHLESSGIFDSIAAPGLVKDENEGERHRSYTSPDARCPRTHPT